MTVHPRAAGPRSDATDATEFLQSLGRRVRLLRLTRELTQDQLARASGMSRSFISLVEHGQHGVDIVRLFRIAAALGMPLRDLIDVSHRPT